ncbi:uncharacterized protein [Onthophagus taurus]|uniref:uncharacterized protein n=1 Tax=Onthophagus taurus TaxID=166361 RepID=UPI000C20DE42|nr:uncharacterized protein LOC111425864 [Onthophagus taurus]
MELSSENKWNLRSLEAPPFTSYKTLKVININSLIKCCEAAQEFFGNQIHLEGDSLLLSRTVYRMKYKFRTDKGFKFMQKLNRSLKKYFELNFFCVIKDFYDLLPETVQVGSYLPTNNMLDYLIVRLQGLTALMNYVSESAKTAADLMEQRMSIGHFWKMAFYSYALLSRIWFLSNDIVRFCCKLYMELLPLRNVLDGEHNWVGIDYQFPSNLESWLNINKSENNLNSYQDQNFHSECGNKEDELSAEESDTLKKDKPKSAFELMVDDDEIGEVIHKKNEERIVKKRKKKGLKKKTNNSKEQIKDEISSLEIIENLTDFVILNKFIEKESNLRTQDRNKCVFKCLDGLEWKMLLGKIKKLRKNKKNVDKNLQLAKSIEILKASLCEK